MKKVQIEGIFIDKHGKVKRVLTEEKLDDVAYFLQNSPNKSLRCLGQQAGISKCMESYEASKFLCL